MHQQQLIFDFTKRKRWADLLVTELTEAIMLVLSETGQVWYCGPAVEDLLGWKDEEVVDGNFCDIMNADDHAGFQRLFAESIRTGTDLLAYARLQCKTAKDLYPSVPAPQTVVMSQGTEDSKPLPKEVLFEIKGYPHFTTSADNVPGTSEYAQADRSFDNLGNSVPGVRSNSDSSFRCFFAMAKPYPSRNTAMLNTFLELKMENERLQSRLQAVRAQAERMNISTVPPAMPRVVQNTASASTSMLPSFPLRRDSMSTSNYSINGQTTAGESSSYPAYETSISGPSVGTTQNREEDLDAAGDSGQPRKKNKRATGSEMYVCTQCGRTDSPEWRKGPHGPKTLCNACGLRWAKSNRPAPKETPAVPTPAATNVQRTFSDVAPGVSGTGTGPSPSSSGTTLHTPPVASTAQGGGYGAGPGPPFMSFSSAAPASRAQYDLHGAMWGL